MPARTWLTSRWREEVADTLAHSRLAADGWLTADGVSRYRQQLLAGGEATLQQWYVYVLEHWYRQHGVASTAVAGVRAPEAPARFPQPRAVPQ